MAAKTTIQTVPKGTTFNLYELPSNWSISGYDFLGWDVDPTVTTPTYSGSASISGGFSNDVQLYAIWQAQVTPPGTTYTLSFNSNGGTGMMESLSCAPDTEVTVPECSFVPEQGYGFVSWNTSADGTGTSYIPDQSTIILSADTVLYAIWTPMVPVTITYNANGGDGMMDPTNTYAGYQTIVLACNFSSPSQHVFDSWNTSPLGDGDTYMPGQVITPSSNISLYAIWTETSELPVLVDGKLSYKSTKNSEWATANATIQDQVFLGTNSSAVKLAYECMIPSKDSNGNDVTSIGNGAIHLWSAQKIYFPSTIETIEEEACWMNGNLDNVEIPDSVTTIGRRAFAWNDLLTTVTIGSGVRNIGEEAFYRSGLQELTIPVTVPDDGIGYNAFGNTQLTCLRFSGRLKVEVKSMANYPWGLYGAYIYADDTPEDGGPGLPVGSEYRETVDGVEWTFNVKQNAVPPNVRPTQDVGLYSEVVGFSSDAVGSVSVPEILGGHITKALRFPHEFVAPNVTTLTIPNGVTTDFGYIYSWPELLKVTFPGSMSIDDYVITDCPKLSCVEMLPGIQNIKAHAISRCPAVTDVTIPLCDTKLSEIFSAGSYDSIRNVIVAYSVSSICDEFCYQCRTLVNLTLPSSLRTIGNNAFNYCKSIVNIVIPEGVTSIGSWSFANCTALQSVSIPSSISDDGIGKLAFQNDPSATVTFHGRTLQEVQAMTNYPWGLNGSRISVTSS